MSKHSDNSKNIRLWGEFLWSLRCYLHDCGLTEVTTPSLVKNSGMEPYLFPFETEWLMGSRRERLRLPTSPEIHLKKLIAEGAENIYEIKSCFRNQELTATHEPEFLMLEWYRTNANLDKVLEDLLGLVALFSEGSPVVKTSFSQLFHELFQFELKPTTSFEDLLALGTDYQIDLEPAGNFDEAFQLILDQKIEPSFSPESVTIVKDFPPSQAALANLNERGFAERFEMYWKGLELANAFDELRDPKEQRRRHEADLRARKEQGLPEIPLDESFFNALEKGLPPTGGIALGLDRLFMAVYDIPSIQQARPFNIEDQC